MTENFEIKNILQNLYSNISHPSDQLMLSIISNLQNLSIRDNIPELKMTVRTSLNAFRQLKYLQKYTETPSETDILEIFENLLLIPFLPTTISQQFYKLLNDLLGLQNREKKSPKPDAIEISTDNEYLSIGSLKVEKRTPSDIALVPNPMYFENETQTKELQKLLISYTIPDNPILLIGNQGVGKNKMVDYLLYLLNAGFIHKILIYIIALYAG